MAKANHRVVAGTKRGRQLAQAKGAREISIYDKQVNPFEDYNRMIDEKKRLKKLAKGKS